MSESSNESSTTSKSPLERMVEDLSKSGLTVQDMLARLLDDASRVAVGVNNTTSGYVIPYFDINGKLTQFYRVKLLDNTSIKYLQVKDTPNHVYFPKNFSQIFKSVQYKFCILTEGEKKAALCCRMGLPAVAFGGVDSWINKTLVIPKGVEISSGEKATKIKLPSANMEATLGSLAVGFQELIDVGLENKTTFFIIYDRDGPNGTSPQPQRAAARLGYELRFKGFHIAQIRQLVPPAKFAPVKSNGRATIEDILLHSEGGGIDGLSKLIADNYAQRTAFPPHPSVREHVAKQLQKPRLARRALQSTALSILTELDIRGTRMWSPDDLQMYYFSQDNNHLMKVGINTAQLVRTQETEFGQMLYQNFGLSMAADTKLVQWLGTQFASEDPLEYVTPHKIIARPGKGEDVVRFQINNGQYVKVTGDPKDAFRILSNGAENVLFESQYDLVQNPGINAKELELELKKQFNAPIKCWWQEVLKEVKLKYPGKQSQLISYLYYMSPFLNRWRGTQLPVEIVTGEAGSGKSTLFEIRLNVLTGDPILRNTPMSVKDWYASLASSGGMQVIDNVGKSDKQMREAMSDELCRLITEPNPRIQMRKYFTEADERTIPLNTVFGFTAIQAPFQNSDLLQRSITLELDKSSGANDSSGLIFDSHWKEKQINKYGGRTGWVAHHMLVLHRFFKLVKQKWNDGYMAKNRLVNIEQSMMLMAEVFGHDASWIPDYMNDSTTAAMSGSDWTLEGLIAYAELARAREVFDNKNRLYKDKEIVKTFSTTDVAAWAATHEDYEKNFTLTNARSLGRYMSQHRYNLQHIAGIVEWGHKANKQHYRATEVAMKEARDVSPPDDPRRSRRGLGPILPELTTPEERENPDYNTRPTISNPGGK